MNVSTSDNMLPWVSYVRSAPTLCMAHCPNRMLFARHETGMGRHMALSVRMSAGAGLGLTLEMGVDAAELCLTDCLAQGGTQVQGALGSCRDMGETGTCLAEGAGREVGTGPVKGVTVTCLPVCLGACLGAALGRGAALGLGAALGRGVGVDMGVAVGRGSGRGDFLALDIGTFPPFGNTGL